MNEKIEDLMYHAGLTASGCWDELGTYEQEAIKKFAELIILRCCEIADEVERADVPTLASKFIKAHFGVEE
jgi:hypothetical protein